VCALTPAALKARREGLLARLLQRAQAHEELPEGHRLQFHPTDDTLAAIAQLISLELTGPPGTREFISALFDV
jgi:hypothetical protein